MPIWSGCGAASADAEVTADGNRLRYARSVRVAVVVALAGCCPDVEGARVAFSGSIGANPSSLAGEDSDAEARPWTLDGTGNMAGMLRGCVADARTGLGFDLPVPYVADQPLAVALAADPARCDLGWDPPGPQMDAAVTLLSPMLAPTSATGTLTVRQVKPLAVDIDVTFADGSSTIHVVGVVTYTAATVPQRCL